MIKIVTENYNEVSIQGFIDALKSSYAKYFPHSRCITKLSRYGCLYINCYLAGDGHELSGGYWENDMFKIGFVIDMGRGVDATHTIPSELVLECTSHYYFTKPDVSYVAYGSKSVPFRKVKGSPEKCLKAFEKFVERLKLAITDDLHNDVLHKNHTNLVKAKIS